MIVAIGRILAGLVALASALYALAYGFRMAQGGGLRAVLSPFAFWVLLFGTIAIAFGLLALPGTDGVRARRIGLSLAIGAGVGVVGAIAGTAWVWWRDPDNNLAPILGMFVTGPAGFVVGTAAAAIVFRYRSGPPDDVTGRSGRHR